MARSGNRPSPGLGAKKALCKYWQNLGTGLKIKKPKQTKPKPK